MKGGKQEFSSLDYEADLKQDIREAAANLVNDVIFRAKEMAQRSVIQHQAFSVVEEESEDALLEEELASQYPNRNRFQSFSGPTPEIQIDFVEDRTPSPDEPSSYVAPVYQRQVKIKHSSASSGDESDSNENLDSNGKPHEITASRIPNGQVHESAVERKPIAQDGVAESSRKKGAKEYMSSKPGSLPFVDDSPPGLGSAETPSEATISARVAATKLPRMAADLKIDLAKDPSLRCFVEEYIRGISEQAQLLADERARKSIPHAKYHSPTDGARASVVITVKPNEGPWYDRVREALSRCLQSTCFCIKIGRQPEAV